MRLSVAIARRFASDRRGLTSIEFALAAASLAIAVSAVILAFGLGIHTDEQARYAARDDVDPVVTGSIGPTPQRGDCPDRTPVVILRR